jgi:hypothetical protein
MTTYRGALNVKWRELVFSLFPSSALKCVPWNAKGLRWSCGLWCSAENLRVEPFDLWHSAVKFYQGVGIPHILASVGWHSAVCLRAVCQEVIPVVAIRGMWPRNLANDQIPAPAILHRQFPCLFSHKILTRDFLVVRQIRGGLLRPKLYTNGLSWQTI